MTSAAAPARRRPRTEGRTARRVRRCARRRGPRASARSSPLPAAGSAAEHAQRGAARLAREPPRAPRRTAAARRRRRVDPELDECPPRFALALLEAARARLERLGRRALRELRVGRRARGCIRTRATLPRSLAGVAAARPRRSSRALLPTGCYLAHLARGPDAHPARAPAHRGRARRTADLDRPRGAPPPRRRGARASRASSASTWANSTRATSTGPATAS